MGQLARRGGPRGEELLKLGTFGGGQNDHVFLVHAGQDTGCPIYSSNHVSQSTSTLSHLN